MIGQNLKGVGQCRRSDHQVINRGGGHFQSGFSLVLGGRQNFRVNHQAGYHSFENIIIGCGCKLSYPLTFQGQA